MEEACLTLIGHHNFNGFRSHACQATNPVRTLIAARLTFEDTWLRLAFSAPAFLHNQVRIMVGTLVEIGLGKKALSCIHRAFETGLRQETGITAPPHGLYLMKVLY